MSNSCIPKPELSEFVLGKLDQQRSESIASHIDDCVSCQDTVVALAEQSDTFVAGMQAAHAAGDDLVQNENALRAGLHQVACAIRQTSESVLRASWPREETTQIDEIGPYELISRLGIGGMGTVYKARHKKLKREVAIKLLPRDRWPNTDVVTRFEREMEAIGRLDHPHIVRASDAGEEEGMHYLVMEYVDGLDLSRLVRRVGRLSTADACELIRQAAIGLQYAHDNRLVHRDIKPSNLILGWQPSSGVSNSAKPTLKILDLGLALLGEEYLHHKHELTTVGQLMGTLDYMSPEQGLDSHDVDSRTDIFSLGATLFKLLTGQAPLEAISVTTPLKKLTWLATKQLPSIGTIREDLPEGLILVVDKMLARDSDERYSNAREVAEALAPFCAKANLASLLRRGLAAEENHPAVGVPAALSRLPQTQSRPGRNQPPFRRWVTWGLAAAGFSFGAFLIYLETDKGQIRIDAKVADVEVEIRQGDRVVDTIEVVHVGSSKSTRIRSGKYNVVLKNAGKDVRISRDTVTISRGASTPTVTVERIANRLVQRRGAAASYPSANLPVRQPVNREGIEIFVFVDTKKTPVEELQQNIGYSSVSLMADGVNKRASDGAKGPATLALAHGCRLLGFQRTANRVQVRLLVPTDEQAAGNQRGITQVNIDNLKGSGFTFWLDHLDNDPVQAISPVLGRPFPSAEEYGPASGLATTPDTITYDGRTFAQWLAELKVERKAERMLDAVQALHRLYDDDQSEAAIVQMLSSMRVYGSLVEDESPEGQLVKAVRESLNDMQTDQVYDAILREIQFGNAKSREFLGWFIVPPTQGYDNPVAEYIGQHPQRLGEALIGVAKSELPSTRAWAVQTLTKVCAMAPDFAAEHAEVLDLLRQAAKADDLNNFGFGAKPSSLTALEVLAEHNPNRATVDLLIEQTKDNAPYHRLWAIQALQKVGPGAAPAIPRLIHLLRAEFDADYPFMQQIPGSWGGMGGAAMYGGGVGGPPTSPIYQATTPDVRTEIVKLLGTMGDKAAPAIPDLLKIMEEETKLDASRLGGGGGAFGGGGGGYGNSGVVMRMMLDPTFRRGPSEQMASDFMVKCFIVIKNCRATEAIPLLTKYVSGREIYQHGDYSDAMWRSTAEETLNALGSSADTIGDILPGVLKKHLEDSGKKEIKVEESKPPAIEPMDGPPTPQTRETEAPSIEPNGRTPR